MVQTDLVLMRRSNEPTFLRKIASSESGQERSLPRSLDHFIGELLNLRGNVDAKRLSGLEVKDKLELGWQLDRQLCGSRTQQNLVHEGGAATKHVRYVGAV
jgi:hypothetical protein